MNEYDYSCRCGSRGETLSFLRIDKEEEMIYFFCHRCQKEFFTRNKERGYLPNIYVGLRQRYPPREALAV